MTWTFETKPGNCFAVKSPTRFGSTDIHVVKLPEGVVKFLHGSRNGTARLEVRIENVNGQRKSEAFLDLLREKDALRVLKAEVIEDKHSRAISSEALHVKIGFLLKLLKGTTNHPNMAKLASLHADLSRFSSLEQLEVSKPVDYKLLVSRFSRQGHVPHVKLLDYLRSVVSTRGVEITDSTSKKLVKGAFAKGDRKVVIPRFRALALLHNVFATSKIKLISIPSTQEDYKQVLIAAFLLKILPERPPGVEPWEFERLRCALRNEGNTSKLIKANAGLPVERRVDLTAPFTISKAQFTPFQKEIHIRALNGDVFALIVAHHLGLENFSPLALSVIATHVRMPISNVRQVIESELLLKS